MSSNLTVPSAEGHKPPVQIQLPVLNPVSVPGASASVHGPSESCTLFALVQKYHDAIAAKKKSEEAATATEVKTQTPQMDAMGYKLGEADRNMFSGSPPPQTPITAGAGTEASAGAGAGASKAVYIPPHLRTPPSGTRTQPFGHFRSRNGSRDSDGPWAQREDINRPSNNSSHIGINPSSQPRTSSSRRSPSSSSFASSSPPPSPWTSSSLHPPPPLPFSASSAPLDIDLFRDMLVAEGVPDDIVPTVAKTCASAYQIAHEYNYGYDYKDPNPQQGSTSVVNYYKRAVQSQAQDNNNQLAEQHDRLAKKYAIAHMLSVGLPSRELPFGVCYTYYHTGICQYKLNKQTNKTTTNTSQTQQPAAPDTQQSPQPQAQQSQQEEATPLQESPPPLELGGPQSSEVPSMVRDSSTLANADEGEGCLFLHYHKAYIFTMDVEQLKNKIRDESRLPRHALQRSRRLCFTHCEAYWRFQSSIFEMKEMSQVLDYGATLWKKKVDRQYHTYQLAKSSNKSTTTTTTTTITATTTTTDNKAKDQDPIKMGPPTYPHLCSLPYSVHGAMALERQSKNSNARRSVRDLYGFLENFVRKIAEEIAHSTDRNVRKRILQLQNSTAKQKNGEKKQIFSLAQILEANSIESLQSTIVAEMTRDVLMEMDPNALLTKLCQMVAPDLMKKISQMTTYEHNQKAKGQQPQQKQQKPGQQKQTQKTKQKQKHDQDREHDEKHDEDDVETPDEKESTSAHDEEKPKPNEKQEAKALARGSGGKKSKGSNAKAAGAEAALATSTSTSDEHSPIDEEELWRTTAACELKEAKDGLEPYIKLRHTLTHGGGQVNPTVVADQKFLEAYGHMFWTQTASPTHDPQTGKPLSKVESITLKEARAILGNDMRPLHIHVTWRTVDEAIDAYMRFAKILDEAVTRANKKGESIVQPKPYNKMYSEEIDDEIDFEQL